MEIDSVLITQHAMERFRQRYEALKGVQLSDTELVDKLSGLIMRARPEPENPVLELRRAAHGGVGEYLLAPPWRFVFSDKGLETCEIMPQEMLVVKNPIIPSFGEKTRFSVKIKTDRRRLLTEITRSCDKKTLHLQNLIEVNAIIRSLRILGFEVNRMAEPTRLEIVVPQDTAVYRIEPLAKFENILISLGHTDLFPLGLQRAYCSGITKTDLERIVTFLQVNKSQ